MAEGEIRLRVNLATRDEAQAVAADVTQHGGSAEIAEEKGILPLAVLLVLAIPPGVSLLAIVINRIVHTWRDHGVLIDARGTGAPTIKPDRSLPYGTVVVLTRDGTTAKRSDLPEIDLGSYVAAMVKALSAGASAGVAKAAAEGALAG